MSLTSKTYIKLKEKCRLFGLAKIYARRNIEDSQVALNSSKDHLEDVNAELNGAIEALRQAEETLKEAKQAVNLAQEENAKAYKRLYKDKEYYNKLIDKEFDVKWKMEALELEEKNKTIAKNKKDEQRVVLTEKKKNKSYFSESILKKLSVLPDEIKRIICGFLPFNVRVLMLEDKFKSIITRYHNEKPSFRSNMLPAFLDYIATQPEFLGLITRKEARHQIPSLTPRGFKWRHYSHSELVSYPKLLYNKILWAAEMAKFGNPKFAHKIMKTIIVFGEVEGKYKISSTITAKNYLTIEDLPIEYR